MLKLISALVFSSMFFPAAQGSASEILDNPAMQKCFYCTYRASGYGARSDEAAVWIYERDGGLKCELWPATKAIGEQTFHGVIPEKRVALAHTHPRGMSYEVSPADIKASRELNIPNYVLTFGGGVWKYDPVTKKSTQVADSDFWSRVEKSQPKNFCAQPKIKKQKTKKQKTNVAVSGKKY